MQVNSFNFGIYNTNVSSKGCTTLNVGVGVLRLVSARPNVFVSPVDRFQQRPSEPGSGVGGGIPVGDQNKGELFWKLFLCIRLPRHQIKMSDMGGSPG